MGLSGVDTINLASGTSFAAPTVAGVVAVLRLAFPAATARQVRNAIIMSANPTAVPGATIDEQGAGLVSAQAAHDLLLAGAGPDTPPSPPNPVKRVRAPGITPFYDGASPADPESLTVHSPAAGTWRVQMIGYELHTPDDRYKLRVALDGVVAR